MGVGQMQIQSIIKREYENINDYDSNINIERKRKAKKLAKKMLMIWY
jgi:hypothetical protein